MGLKLRREWIKKESKNIFSGTANLIKILLFCFLSYNVLNVTQNKHKIFVPIKLTLSQKCDIINMSRR